ncbi:MAG: hypothetical protein HY608_00600 [Planctomycetes bacterium]|nr:hypothetical protein [Planctomycetota bacterium]
MLRHARFAGALACLLTLAPSLDASGRSRRSPREASGAKGGIPPELAQRIDVAIERATVQLKALLATELAAAKQRDTRVGPAGHEAGRVALYAHALVVGGVSPSDPLIQDTWIFLRDRPMQHTYDVAITLLLRESMLHPPARPGSGRRERPARQGRPVGAPRAGGNRNADWVQQAANWLASGCNAGMWNYSCPGGADGYPVEELPQPEYGISGTRDTLAFGADLRALLNPKQPVQRTDLSNTQYAVQGLKAASLLGAKPTGYRTLWRVIVARFLQMQETTGPEVQLTLSNEDAAGPDYTIGTEVDLARGWSYMNTTDAVEAYGSMTTCGLATMLIAQSEVPDLTADEQRLVTQAARDGLAWFQINWAVDRNPAVDKTRYRNFGPAKGYYLYGLERCGVLANFRTLGGHNWYQEGAEHLLPAQRTDGSWPGEGAFEPDGVRTAFAILFLARGTSTDYGVGGTD